MNNDISNWKLNIRNAKNVSRHSLYTYLIICLMFLVGHLNKYLTMRLSLDYGPDISECGLRFLIYVAPSENQFILLDDDQSLRNVQDKFWKVKKPLEMFYSFI